MAAAICRHAGARYVVVTDINPARLALASQMGATRVVNVSEESIDTVFNELDMKEGFDVGLEMSGSVEAFKDLLEVMCHGGKVALLGIPEKDTAIDWNTVIFNMLTIKGIYGREMYETWYKMSQMLQSGLDLSKVLTHRYPVDQFQNAFDVISSGQCGKVVLEW